MEYEELIRTIDYTINKIDRIDKLINQIRKELNTERFLMGSYSEYDLIDKYIAMQEHTINIGRNALLINANSKLSIQENG